MSKPKIYISGQITGLSMTEALNNFWDAEIYLNEKGYDVVNPLSIMGHTAIAEMEVSDEEKWCLHMKLDIKALMDCTDIFMLQNWGNSKGAKIERDLAIQLGLKVHHQ